MSFPLEIIFLRAITPAYPANQADIIFDITEGNLRDSFDIIKRYMDGMTVGEKLFSPSLLATVSELKVYNQAW